MDLPISKYGKNERRKFGSINEVIDIPELVEIQKNSYDSFIEEGISEVFEDFSPITDYSDRFELYFLDHKFGDKPPKKNLFHARFAAIRFEHRTNSEICRRTENPEKHPDFRTVNAADRVNCRNHGFSSLFIVGCVAVAPDGDCFAKISGLGLENSVNKILVSCKNFTDVTVKLTCVASGV